MRYRDPISQFVQSAHDPESPEAIASANRHRAIQRSERAAFLTTLFRDGDDTALAAWYRTFLADDPDIIWTLSTPVAARCAVLTRSERVS
jgi:hypothetical protein